MEERQHAIHHIGAVEFSHLCELFQVRLQVAVRQHGCLWRTGRTTREQHDRQVVCLDIHDWCNGLGDELSEVHRSWHITRRCDHMREMRQRCTINLGPSRNCRRGNHHRTSTNHAELALEFGRRRRRIQGDTYDAATQAGKVRNHEFHGVAKQERHSVAAIHTHRRQCTAHAGDVLA